MVIFEKKQESGWHAKLKANTSGYIMVCIFLLGDYGVLRGGRGGRQGVDGVGTVGGGVALERL